MIGDEGWVQAGFNNEFDSEPKSLLKLQPKESDEKFTRISEKHDFINCGRSREETLEPAEVGHRVNSLGKLGQISVHLGRSLKWDPELEHFPDDPEAAKYLDQSIVCRPPLD